MSRFLWTTKTSASHSKSAGKKYIEFSVDTKFENMIKSDMQSKQTRSALIAARLNDDLLKSPSFWVFH